MFWKVTNNKVWSKFVISQQQHLNICIQGNWRRRRNILLFKSLMVTWRQMTNKLRYQICQLFEKRWRFICIFSVHFAYSTIIVLRTDKQKLLKRIQVWLSCICWSFNQLTLKEHPIVFHSSLTPIRTYSLFILGRF